jgi:8-oxo-dGTP diphosphatase
MRAIRNKKGDTILQFVRLRNEQFLEGSRYSPLSASLVVATHEDKVLFVFDRYKRCWELPGGLINPGERARQAGMRELFEESAQTGEQFKLLGVAKFRLRDGMITFAAIFGCRLVTVSLFKPNIEISEISY